MTRSTHRAPTPRLTPREYPDGFYAAVGRAAKALEDGGLDPAVRGLVKLRASQLNGCLFCVDLHVREARQAGEDQRRLDHLAAWRESPLFTGAERAALGYAESATRLGPGGVPDAVWDEAARHFDPAELGALVAGTALINLLNRLAVPIRAVPEDLRDRS